MTGLPEIRKRSRLEREVQLQTALLVVTMLFAPTPLLAQDAPHWASASINIDCTSNCHVPHQALGGGLNPQTGNVNLCLSCHNATGLAKDLPINVTDKAVRGQTGSSHAFDVAPVQDFDGDTVNDTLSPQNTQMLLRIMGGNVVCSTCHNQHKSESAFGGTPRVGNASMLTTLGSVNGLTPGGTFSGAQGTWYLVEIVQGGNQSAARFCYSKDNGISWFPSGCNPPGTTSPNLTANGASPVALDSGVTVTFAAGSYIAQERWEFSAAWPFLRAALDSAGEGSVLCRDCHRAWDMDHTAVQTWNGNPRSHPVGVALGVSGSGFDRTTPLDGNGADQGGAGADANPSNDLRFDGNGNVQCLTCHGVHFIDSNTQTVDSP